MPRVCGLWSWCLVLGFDSEHQNSKLRLDSFPNRRTRARANGYRTSSCRIQSPESTRLQSPAVLAPSLELEQTIPIALGRRLHVHAPRRIRDPTPGSPNRARGIGCTHCPPAGAPIIAPVPCLSAST
ncbi:hypothetical protein DENSPDRAFT_841351 [Dentipellis sp. KUC8613]|nr:hypothetical protein DENSPDRAFT_841351 [Dentipellis sp. KUC8613]